MQTTKHILGPKAIDEAGKAYGRLTVIECAGRDSKSRLLWRCYCDPKLGGCGNETIVRGVYLRRGETRSCGCLERDNRLTSSVTHGHTVARERSPEYWTWIAMKARCLIESATGYKDYGGRGIRICERWVDSFAVFLADMGPKTSPKHSIERIDNNKGYEPGNCRWATRKEQNRNTRNNRMLTHEGVTMCLVDWANKTGINRTTIASRLKSGWSVKDALGFFVK